MEKSGLNLATSQLKLKQENFMKTFQKPRQNQVIMHHFFIGDVPNTKPNRSIDIGKDIKDVA